MPYLRMLTNALASGAIGAAFLLVLVLQLNPQLPLSPAIVLPLYRTLLLFYGAHLALLFFALLVARQMFAGQPRVPAWLSLRVLAWFSTLLAAAAALLMWLNLEGFRSVLPEEGARRMAAGAAATTATALLLFIIALVHYSFGRRGGVVGSTLYALTIAASLVLPLVGRGPTPRAAAQPSAERQPAAVLSQEPSPARVFVFLVDGASLDYISPATAGGRLPNFGRLLDSGAVLHLATIRPTQPAPVWTSVMTGKYPPAHGVRSAAAYAFGGPRPLELLPDLVYAHGLVRVGLLRELAFSAGDVRAAPLWRILAEAGVPVGVVGLPLTFPAVPVRGFLVTDRLHLQMQQPLRYAEADLAWPAETVAAAAADVAASAGGTRLVSGGEAGLDGALVAPIWRDAFYRDLLARLETQINAQVVFVRYEGVDRAGHEFLRYASPGDFGDVTAAERQQYGEVLARQYAFIDAEIGARLKMLGPDDLLLVVSGFGMEPVTPGKRLMARALREPDLSGSHEGAPDGFLLAYGRSVAPGRKGLGALVDVAPTLLYFLGLPVGRDMAGYARTDLFDPRFLANRPITFTPTYGN